jgi:putative ATP-dependent endonuclease of the OLD family
VWSTHDGTYGPSARPLTEGAATALLSEIRVTNFRNHRSGVLRPGRVCAFIGEPGAGKSNLLFALRALLDPGFDLTTADVTAGQRAISIEATLSDGRAISLADHDGRPPLVHFPVAGRGGELVSGSGGSSDAERVHAAIRSALERAPAPRVALVRGLEACTADVSGVVFAIEEPELFLAPQAYRYLRRLIQRLADSGNQDFFTTHAPGLLSVAALEEVNLVRRDELGVATVEQLGSIDVDDAFRVMCEFDAERSELFFSRAAILVEGMTEKIAFPFVFQALGRDADREQISIVECGGKANLPLFIEICRRACVPYVAVHDSDLRPGREPAEGVHELNALIRRRAGARRTVVLEPDFEGVAGFRSRKARKPEHAWRRLAAGPMKEPPAPLVRAVRLALELAHPREPSYS